MIQLKKSYLIFFIVIISSLGIFLGGYFDLLASVNSSSTTGSCDMRGTSGGCSFSTGVGPDFQGYSGNVHGDASGGGDGAIVGMSACLNPDGIMWTGECNTTFCSNQVIDTGFRTCDTALSNFDPSHNYKYIVAETYANNAIWYFLSANLNGRKVSINNFSSNNYNVPVGSSFTVSWDADQALISPFTVLTWDDFSGGVVLVGGNGSENVPEDGNRSFTCSRAGSATFELSARGPSGSGPLTELRNFTVNCEVPLPGSFNLSSSACYGGPDQNGNGKFNLSWTSSSNATSYDIYAHAWSGGAWQWIGNTTGLSWTATQPAGIDWYFKVVAKNSVGSINSTPDNLFAGNCPFPSADIKANGSNGPITIGYNAAATISWTSSNASSCSVSPTGWVGTSNNGISTGNLTSSQTYALTCPNGFGISAQDSVVVNISPPTVDLKVKEKGQPDSSYTDGPLSVSYNTRVTLKWTPANSGSCSATGDWSGSKSVFGGTEDTSPLNQVRSYNHTITCTGNGSANDSVRVDVGAPVPSASNITVTQPNYCVSGPAATTNWDYSDPASSPQYAYQVQIDDSGSFNSPEVDSGKVICQNCRSYYSGTGLLIFNKTYKSRVRVWNTFDISSAWQESSSWQTPNHAYPNVNSPYQFTWSPTNPSINKPVQFTDHTLFDSKSNNQQWSWTFVPAGGGSGSSTAQNPSYTFNAESIYQVTENVRDNAMPGGTYCSFTQPVNVQKPIPVWKEIAPR